MQALTILITGASGGIGAATALRLATTPFSTSTTSSAPKYAVKTLILHYNTNHSKTQLLTEQISRANRSIKVIWLQADLSLPEGVEALHRSAVSATGGEPINVLFANAGTTSGRSGPTGTLEGVSLETFERTWRVNTLSVYQLTQLVVPGMVEGGFGRVIYNSSVAALTGGVVGPHYASSKSGLHGMMHYFSPRYAKEGVTFNAVAPALIEDTTMLPKGEGNEGLKEKIPVRRLGQPDEIASVVCLMIENGYVNNKVWVVDGGWVPR
ncbi:putative oxidoreductase YmfI [Cytospora mali]|uniref:Oxidoreductase YmfI n=1 Tax=Cytospora mali TaxID=578113 RepID=A0A194UN37_CYTMA|nr:putative oxidoreductase YmfI [Valsa mali var. pyri (nom. inval.)]